MRIVIVVNWWCVLVHIGYISWNLSTRYKLVLNCLWSRWQETLMWLGWQNSVIGRGVWGMGLCRQERQQVFEFTLKSWPFKPYSYQLADLPFLLGPDSYCSIHVLTCTGTESNCHPFLISDDKPVGTDWEEIFMFEEIILHSLMSVMSIIFLCVIYKVLGGRGFPSLKHPGGIRPHPMSRSCSCCWYAGRATSGTYENHNFIYSFIVLRMVHLWIVSGTALFWEWNQNGRNSTKLQL